MKLYKKHNLDCDDSHRETLREVQPNKDILH